MNKLFLLFALLLSLSVNAQEASQPYKGANTILIHTSDSSGVALKKLARLLIVEGIEPDKIDAEVGYMTTKGKAVGQISPAVYSYKVISTPEPTGALLSITGEYAVKLSAANTIVDKMVWTKGNLNQSKQCFALIERVALAYPLARVGYTTKR